MTRKLTNYEQETIINFNKAEDTAYIFTYEKTWQQHLEMNTIKRKTRVNSIPLSKKMQKIAALSYYGKG